MLHSAAHRCAWKNSLARRLVVLGACTFICASGCSRAWYREQADEDAFEILSEKTSAPAWSPPAGFSIEPSSDSRLFDPSPLTEPVLPDPTPRLYEYDIPPGIGRRPAQHWQPVSDVPKVSGWEQTAHILKATHRESGGHSTQGILLAGLLMQNDGIDTPTSIEIEPVTVPPDAWASVPQQCRVRMFDFESVRLEYETSHGQRPPETDRDPAPRVDLDDIIELALLNSREYQTQKEQLYRVALRLSLQRYDYELKASPFGNGTGGQFDTRQSNDASFSRLRVPSAAQAEALLNTGSTLVTRFANDVLLTFGGPDGFAADIGSELLFEMTHSVFQNDVRFERLTQAERNVVYAARDFMRFRRSFYLQLATQYYNLLRTYRQVEIDALNYVNLVRVYSERKVEVDEGQSPRVQIDQVEQNALNGRSRLISTCNGLENSLDRIKILIGLPTESPLSIDLAELDELTREDEIAVSMELVRRARSRLDDEQNRDDLDEARILHRAAELASRIRDALELIQRPLLHVDASNSRASRNQYGLAPEFTGEGVLSELSRLISRLHVAELRVLADRVRQRIELDRAAADTPPVRVSMLAREYAQAVLNLLPEEQLWLELLDAPAGARDAIDPIATGVIDELRKTENLSREVQANLTPEGLAGLQAQADQLVTVVDMAVDSVRTNSDAQAHTAGINPDIGSTALVASIRSFGDRLLAEPRYGLTPLLLDTDRALLAALSLRLDLMNSRSFLADEWRGIKLAADDLKSILNLSARQRLFTENESGRPFELDFDEARTDLAITLDAPLNRRAQRNAFREQLLNYQVSRRALMALEDRIKQNVRVDLRGLSLAEEQHTLGIASAALAGERVTSTELQLRLGVSDVTARDFLEAQTAYSQALSQVAARRIQHILSRIQLFVDMEQLQLDGNSRWPGRAAESLVPEIDLPDVPVSDYGQLPPDIEYSEEMLQGLDRWTQ